MDRTGGHPARPVRHEQTRRATSRFPQRCGPPGEWQSRPAISTTGDSNRSGRGFAPARRPGRAAPRVVSYRLWRVLQTDTHGMIIAMRVVECYKYQSIIRRCGVPRRKPTGTRPELRTRRMKAPDAVPPQDTFLREGQGRLLDPEHRLPLHVTGYDVLKAGPTGRTGSIPRPAAEPPDSSRSQPITGDYDASGGQPHQANTSTPPGKPHPVTGVGDALASASSPPTFGPVRALGGP